MPSMSLREGILDALVDERDNVAKVQKYLDFMRFEHTREALVNTLTDLLMQGTIEIIRQPELKEDVLSAVDERAVNDLCFALTEKGRQEWEAILV